MAAHIKYDVIIVGGGLSGLTMACLLGQRGMKIACVDQADPSVQPPDLRTTAISFGSRKVLETAGVWDGVKQSCPIDDIQILDGNSPVLLEFMSAEVSGKSFGWIVDNYDLKCALMRRMAACPSVHHIAPAMVDGFSVEVEHDHASVCLENGDTLSAALIIGADGRGSSVRNWMATHCGLQTRGWSYKQRAVICTASHEHPHDNIAVEHFWPQGPFAILPMADDEHGGHRSSVVFTEHGPDTRSLMHYSDAEFEIALAARFPERYGDIKLASVRKAFPLGLVHADRYIAPRMVLVADAAHGIHPIAGQGLNLGFRDLKVLDEILGAGFEAGGDIGTQDLLETYQARRRPDNMAMIAVTDALNRLFSNTMPPVRFARRAGLRVVSRLKPVRRFFIKQAMGDMG